MAGQGQRRALVVLASIVLALLYSAFHSGGFAVEIQEPRRGEATVPPDSLKPSGKWAGHHGGRELGDADETTSDDVHVLAAGQAVLRTFVGDASFSARCKVPIPPLVGCPKRKWGTEDTSAARPDDLVLMQPVTTGPDTTGMKLRPVEGVNGHHKAYLVYAERTYTTGWLEGRIPEFVGVHTNASYDCEATEVFRLYHQCRAAMCDEYERRRLLAAVPRVATEPFLQLGNFPIVDEEYFEFAWTLATAHDAATRGSPYVFIELGARYGTWVARAGAAYRRFSPNGKLSLLAVEGNCPWFQKMEEHIACNGLASVADPPTSTLLVLGYAAPRSFNKVVLADPTTYTMPRAISLLDVLPAYPHVDIIDFDIQGFEFMTVSETGVLPLLAAKVGFLHFGTHSTDIERNLLSTLQATKQWCVVYFFAGAHTKKLNRGHRCKTPFGSSVFNDGVLGMANLKFYPQLRDQCVTLSATKHTNQHCHSIPAALEMMKKDRAVMAKIYGEKRS